MSNFQEKVKVLRTRHEELLSQKNETRIVMYGVTEE